MGQKTNPIGFRLGINRTWDSIWFAKKSNYGNLLIEDFKIRAYIKKNIVNSGVAQVIIERKAKKCIVSIHTSRPGFVIGKKGSDIDKIKKNKELKKSFLNKYKNYPPQLANVFIVIGGDGFMLHTLKKYNKYIIV